MFFVLALVVAVAGLLVWQPWGVPISVRLAAWRLEQVDGISSVDVVAHRHRSIHDELARWSVTTATLEPGTSPERAGEIAARAGAAFGEHGDAYLRLAAHDPNGTERVQVMWAEPTTAEHVIDAFTLAEAGAQHVEVYVTPDRHAVGYQVRTGDLTEWEYFDALARRLGVAQFDLTVAGTS